MRNEDMELVVSMEAYALLAEWAKNHLLKDMNFRIGETPIKVLTRGAKHSLTLVGVDQKLSQDAYSEYVKTYLADYKSRVFPNISNGYFRGKPHSHILPCTKKNKAETVSQYNTLESVRGLKMLLRPQDLHQYAQHLNSSQMMCYNFFRPYLNDNGMPNESLFSLLNTVDINIPYDKNAVAKFEYEQTDDEWAGERTGGSKGTNFDFYLKSGQFEVFFEIKYTENGFGTFSNNEDEVERHRKKYDSFYGKKIKACPALKIKDVPFEEFRLNYQLLRNTIRLTDKSKFVVFLYDANNPHTFKQVHAFIDSYITDDYKQHVIALEWQKLVMASHPDEIYEFWNKYLNYLNN